MAGHVWAFERGTLWVRDGTESDTIRVLPKIRATLGEAGPEDVHALATAMGLDDPAEALRRFGEGRRCFVARVDDAIASYGWSSRDVERIGELERLFRMAPDEAYIWDCSTLPKYRGQHLYCALLTCMVAALARDGVRRIWIGASLQNTPSIRGFATAGFRPVLTLTYARLLGMRHVWLAGDANATPELVARARECLSV